MVAVLKCISMLLALKKFRTASYREIMNNHLRTERVKNITSFRLRFLSIRVQHTDFMQRELIAIVIYG